MQTVGEGVEKLNERRNLEARGGNETELTMVESARVESGSAESVRSKERQSEERANESRGEEESLVSREASEQLARLSLPDYTPRSTIRPRPPPSAHRPEPLRPPIHLADRTLYRVETLVKPV